MRLALAIFALTTAAIAQQTAQQPAQDPIRAARAASNQAIAARDLPAYTATITPDFTVTTGNGSAYTRDGFLTLWAQLFHDPVWQGCIRTPDSIETSATQPLAAEHGHFVCRAHRPDGTEIYTGTYLAMWLHEANTWKTRSELFVTLACTGSTHCQVGR